MSFPTLEQVRTSLNPLQGTIINGYYCLIDPYTGEWVSYRQITSTWTAAKCDGFMFIAVGANYYERVITTPYLNAKWFGAIGDGSLHPVSGQIDPNTGIPFANLAAVNVYYPTAYAMTDEVDGLAIQNAINFAIYNVRPGGTKMVWLPSGTYNVSDTVHLGYGDTFTSVVLYGGSTPQYTPGNPNQKGATIQSATTVNISDRPLVNIQGARESMIQGIALLGINNANPGYNNLIWGIQSHYQAGGVITSGNSRYAPYAGISIDAYGGPQPTAPFYPLPNYPKTPNALGISVTGAYNKNTSSQVQIDNCLIKQFIVGIVQQPSGVEANGDFIRTTNTMVNSCMYGISSSGGQARLEEIVNCNIDMCWQMVTNSVHGAQRGRINLIQNTHFSGYQILQFVETAWNQQLVLRDCYCESTFRIGYFGANRTNACNLTLDNCTFNFDHTTGVPSCLVQSDAPIQIAIKGGRIVSAPTLLTSGGVVVMDGVSVTSDCSASTGASLAGNDIATWSNFLTFTCGLPAGSGFVPGKVMSNCVYAANGLSAALTASGVGDDVGYESSENFNADHGHWIGGYFAYTGHLSSSYMLRTVVAMNNFPTGAMFSNRVLTIPTSYLFISRLVSVSDILIDRSYNTLWLVISINATTAVLVLLNGFQNNSGGTITYESLVNGGTPISTTGNQTTVHTGFNRNYRIQNNGNDGDLALIGDVTTGSGLITNIMSANGSLTSISTQFAVLDSTKFLYVYLISGTDPTVRASSWQGPFRVVSINPMGFQVQVDMNIMVTGKVYLFNTSIYKV